MGPRRVIRASEDQRIKAAAAHGVDCNPTPTSSAAAMPSTFLSCSGRLDALQEQLGHRDINTTRIYLRLTTENVMREVAKGEFRLPLLAVE